MRHNAAGPITGPVFGAVAQCNYRPRSSSSSPPSPSASIGLFGSPKLIDRSLFRPYWFLRRKEYDTVIMSGFVHADLMHLIFNMMTFYFFAFRARALHRHDAVRRAVPGGPVDQSRGDVLQAAEQSGVRVRSARRARSRRCCSPRSCSSRVNRCSSCRSRSRFRRRCSRCCISRTPTTRREHPHGRINHDAHLGGAITGLLFVAVMAPSAYGHLLTRSSDRF